MPLTRSHVVLIEIDCADPQGREAAADRVNGWLETFGHTACSHGFEFIAVASYARPSKYHKQRRRTPIMKGSPQCQKS